MDEIDRKVEDFIGRARANGWQQALAPDSDLWCVCWAAEVYDDDGVTIYAPFAQYRGDPVPRAEAERRMAWGRETYPTCIYWLERA